MLLAEVVKRCRAHMTRQHDDLHAEPGSPRPPLKAPRLATRGTQRGEGRFVPYSTVVGPSESYLPVSRGGGRPAPHGVRLHGVHVLLLEKETGPVPFVRIVRRHIRTIERMAIRGLLERTRGHERQRPATGF